MPKTLLLLPGDGIGPEVTAVSRRLVEELVRKGLTDVDVRELPFGGSAFDEFGTSLPCDTLSAALDANAVLLGAVGGPQWKSLPYEKRPEAGLLALRDRMQVFANLRPAYCFAPLVEASTLKPDIVSGLDIMFVRELVGGVYFGNPRGLEVLPDGQRRGFNTHVYTTFEIERVARVAFEQARQRKGRVCSVEKSNVMEAGLLWREVVSQIHHDEYEDVEITHMLADNCAMQLVRSPNQFDVILTDNLFGDILSDVAAMLTGSIGMLPSAAVGAADAPGLYEPIHGSAPDIAGRGTANPCASVLSLAMAFRHSLHAPEIASLIESAVAAVLGKGVRTADIGGRASTSDVADALIAAVQALGESCDGSAKP